MMKRIQFVLMLMLCTLVLTVGCAKKLSIEDLEGEWVAHWEANGELWTMTLKIDRFGNCQRTNYTGTVRGTIEVKGDTLIYESTEPDITGGYEHRECQFVHGTIVWQNSADYPDRDLPDIILYLNSN